ncbi:MAG: uridine kinase [Candidatus Hydromicrobium americanum]|nr:MAG: uridine kinase [Candidatus Hydromicrobium americanum]
MHGDLLLIQKKHIKAAENIVERILSNTLSNKLNKFIIAISGESGSGKSEVAHLISQFLKDKGILAKILHTDNYYAIPPKRRYELRKKNGLESINYTEYNWGLIKKHIKEFKESKISVLPFVDLLTDQIDKLITDFKEINVLILEGLYSLRINHSVNLKVFIDLTYHDTKKAQILRGKEKFDEFRSKVLEREHEVVQSLKPKADLIITKDFDVVNVRDI